jgi:putative flippase GtrA
MMTLRADANSPPPLDASRGPRRGTRRLRHFWALPIVRFGVVSLLATAVNALLYLGLRACLPAGPVGVGGAVAGGYLTGAWVNFVLARRWVFHASHFPVAVEGSLVIVINTVGLALTEGVTLLLHLRAGWSDKLAYAVALVVSFLWNYLARRRWIYPLRSRS